VVQAARHLLGMRLVRLLDGQRVSGLIVEAEAYDGEADLACHAHVGRTPRTEVMYGPPGRAYVYFTYGMHWCLNCVTGPEGYPAAVLLRAIQPEEGLELIATRRSERSQGEWCNGPGKLTQALDIDGALNGADLTAVVGGLWIEASQPVAEENVLVGPRVGIKNVPEPWRSQPWRFRVKGD
jgi:DNA-3-methyladenine glycosylase